MPGTRVSDSFDTDADVTMLPVLSHWRRANSAAFVPACIKLCGLMRLRQLPEDYLLCTWPHIPWFVPLGRREHAFGVPE
ncbi:hypothetical protein TSOC_010178 [Tetrabaena socialis]|uniref:Uncharacterized protein n=1 Tax=Tetrabaena socialis TaxID=47790 RepID=A0A2J7ZTY3_9CHLO|nr:hypothetical protein TSOC_010178 [Tetrabaena socialis]|eukprot:PNH03731.1 hypothetical protein TSOC_010178 [Tetrabaena socialis]